MTKRILNRKIESKKSMISMKRKNIMMRKQKMENKKWKKSMKIKNERSDRLAGNEKCREKQAKRELNCIKFVRLRRILLFFLFLLVALPTKNHPFTIAILVK